MAFGKLGLMLAEVFQGGAGVNEQNSVLPSVVFERGGRQGEEQPESEKEKVFHPLK